VTPIEVNGQAESIHCQSTHADDWKSRIVLWVCPSIWIRTARRIHRDPGIARREAKWFSSLEETSFKRQIRLQPDGGWSRRDLDTVYREIARRTRQGIDSQAHPLLEMNGLEGEVVRMSGVKNSRDTRRFLVKLIESITDADPYDDL